MDSKNFKIDIDKQVIELQTGFLAPQANASVVATYGGTVALATVVMGPQNDSLDYFPLTVDFVDKLYAGGQIKSSRWLKREFANSDEAILSSRLIDRSIRPLFPEGFKHEVQVMVTILSNDKKHDSIIAAFTAVSAALAISDIPFNGPVSATKIGRLDNQLVVNPDITSQAQSSLDLLVCTDTSGINMIEAGADIIDNPTMFEAIKLAKLTGDKINQQINEFAKKYGKDKIDYTADLPSADLIKQVEKIIKDDVANFFKNGADNGDHMAAEQQIVAKAKESFAPKLEAGELKTSHLVEAVAHLIKKYLRSQALKGNRFDGRQPDQIRPLEIKAGVLPCTHGSAFFGRGLTQALTITTLSGLSEQQYFQDSSGESTKRYIHFYSAPPYSTGQTGRFGRPGRREVGHGALAEKALKPVIPSQEEFPYTILLNSEVLSQNGSSSMASTCGSTLSLMDAGVPIKDKVAGISVGMVSDDQKYTLLTDIAGIEDHNGDMDFKITGTKDGITAIQLDIKRAGLGLDMVEDVFAASLKARLQILDAFNKVISTPRDQVSPLAPKIRLVKIPEEKIGEVVGSGGRTIRSLMDQYQVEIDIDDDGLVSVSSQDQQKLDQAVFHIESMVREVQIGEEFDGEVTRVEDYGAFVKFLPGREALLHISQMAQGFVKDPRTLVKVGDKIKVKIAGFNENHQIKLSAPAFKDSHAGSQQFKNFRPNLRSQSSSETRK